MPIWQWVKNNIPPYAEEIIINQEVEQIQETLSNFKQLIPEGFVELGQPKKCWGSTEGLDKVLCERYTFKHGDKIITIDITKELSVKLKLNLENNFCVKEEALSRLPEEGGITINNEAEIFLRKSFVVNNLKKDISGLLKKIEEQKENEKNNKKRINPTPLPNLNHPRTKIKPQHQNQLIQKPNLKTKKVKIRIRHLLIKITKSQLLNKIKNLHRRLRKI